jgi:hypothetical protein
MAGTISGTTKWHLKILEFEDLRICRFEDLKDLGNLKDLWVLAIRGGPVAPEGRPNPQIQILKSRSSNPQILRFSNPNSPS